jgi:alginate export protein
MTQAEHCGRGAIRAALKTAAVIWVLGCLLSLGAGPAGAELAGFSAKAADALQGDWGKINFNIRWRFEHVDQQGLGIAKGDPIRLRLGYLTPKFHGFKGFVEFEGNSPVFFDEYNSTKNGKTQYPVIADPSVAEINQLWLAYGGIADTAIKAGRQKIIYNNQRFLGNVGWRQLEQTYDSLSILNSTLGNSSFNLAYIGNVKNIFGDDVKMSSPLLNLGYHFQNAGKLTAYGYWLDYADGNDSGPFPYAFSTQTYGIRFNGATPLADNLKALYTAEYASQANFQDNPRSFRADYFHLIGGLKIPKAGAGFGDIFAKVGWESLGSNNGVSFQTPLGTNHAFGGWADQFLVTPAQGLRDLYLALGAKLVGVKLLAVYHRFEAETGGANYGHEVDASASKTFAKHYTVLAKYAQYIADQYKTDTQKFWLQLVIAF